jgi:hypothetical protein
MADFSKYTGSAESEESRRAQVPEQHLRPQAEKERAPDYFRRTQEREGRSEWSGGSMGGGTWAGRSR